VPPKAESANNSSAPGQTFPEPDIAGGKGLTVIVLVTKQPVGIV
jgi:hypothetical protein